MWQQTLTDLMVEGEQVTGVALANRQRVNADAVVVALGSYSPLLLKAHGVSLPIYPAKGYSATYQLSDESVAPLVSLTDEDAKIVISRFGQRLRVAGTAEFNGYNLELNAARCRMLDQRIRRFFPQLAPQAEPEYWCGLRPATPSNRPLIGRIKYRNLFLNTGHGTLGWTMSCGSAAALTDLIGDRRPEPEFSFLGEKA